MKEEEKPRSGKEQQPYEAPEVRTEEVFETLALTCTKADTQVCSVPPGGETLRS